MIIIDDKIISKDIVASYFMCHLKSCKGACCVKGDNGAPLEETELAQLELVYPTVVPYLTPEGISAIAEQGLYTTAEDSEYGNHATPLIDGGACAYVTYNHEGIAKCGIQQAYEDGKIDWPKPISCHLYPIRLSALGDDMLALNYDRWDICRPACNAGNREKMPLYIFLREPIIRKFGEDFYHQLVDAARHIADDKR